MSSPPKDEVGRDSNGDGKRSRSGSRERKSRKRSRRSSSRDRDSKRNRGDRDRDRDRGRDRERGRDRDRESRRERGSERGEREERKRRSPSPPDPAKLEEERRKREEAADREAHRDDYTVFVSQIHPKVDERDLFEFFSHVGRVEDIRLIRDSAGKSKGLCYVEFWGKESINKAMALVGQLIGGHPINVAIVQNTQVKPVAPTITAMKLYIGSLHENVSEEDLGPVFEAFGTLDFIDLHKDPATGKSKGFGFVQYKNESDARAALQALNGLEIAGMAIKVTAVEEAGGGGMGGGMPGNIEDLDDDGGRGGLAMTAQGRANLMAKLTRGMNMPGVPSLPSAPTSGSIHPARQNQIITQAPAGSMQMIQPTTCVVVKNMFDPATEEDPEFHLDIQDAVEEEAEKLGSKTRHIFVDPKSMGNVYMRFTEIEGAQKIVKAFNGRWFASRQISAEFVIEATYLMRFPQAK